MAITLTPVAQGRLEVYADGDMIFDRKEAGHYPNYADVTEMKLTLREKVSALST